MVKLLSPIGVGLIVQAIQSALAESLINGVALLVGMTLAIDTSYRP